MSTEIQVIAGLSMILLDKTVISIYGPAGTGKSTFSLQLVGSLLTKAYPYNDQCVWIQASEQFSTKRLSQLFQEHQNKLKYLVDNIFIIPSDGPCRSYQDQSKILCNLCNDDFLLPPGIKFIVVDNISHHLRFQVSKLREYDIYTKFVNTFFIKQLYPLIMFCKRNQINLIMIHEVSYNPDTNSNVPFLHKLFSRIKSIMIDLSKNSVTQQTKMVIKYNNVSWSFGYQLKNIGLVFS